MLDYRTVKSEVLVLGGGMAGLAAAIAAAREGADVLLASWGAPGKSGATYYDVAEVGAMNAPDGSADPTDSAEVFYNDIVSAALSTASLPLCRILAEEAVGALERVAALPGGDAVFERKQGVYKVFRACFSSKPRSHIIHDHFRPLLSVLLAEALRLGVRFLDGVAVAELFVQGGQCWGAYGIDEKGEGLLFLAKAVVLAAGGASQLFAHNMYPCDVMGGGYAAAHRAGARMTNMEFVQMGIGVAHPFINLFEHYLWDSYPKLRNGAGKAFLQETLPEGVTEQNAIFDKSHHFPFSTRDRSQYIEIAVQKEINRGNTTKNGNVLLDLDTHTFHALLQEENNFSKMWRTTEAWYGNKGVDLLKQPPEIACFAHAINGGVLIDEHAMSSVGGLFAVGEVAAGPHGADRLGGNMSLTSQVFGNIAGRESARMAKAVHAFADGSDFMKKSHAFYSTIAIPDGVSAEELLAQIRRCADRSLLIVRNEAGLQSYYDQLRAYQAAMEQKSGGQRPGTIDRVAVNLYHLLESGALITMAARARKESRGSHYREDYPHMSEAYACNYVIVNGTGQFEKI